MFPGVLWENRIQELKLISETLTKEMIALESQCFPWQYENFDQRDKFDLVYLDFFGEKWQKEIATGEGKEEVGGRGYGTVKSLSTSPTLGLIQ